MENNYINLDWNLVERIYIDKAKRLKRIAYRRVNDIEIAEDIFKRSNTIQYFSSDVLDKYLIEELNTIEIYNALNDLDELNRDFIICKFIYGFNNTEISKMFECCDKTVKRKIDKSLEIMRNKLKIE